MDVTAILLFAGKSSRMNSEVNKAFMMLDGEPLVVHSILKFRDIPDIKQIICVFNEKDFDKTSEIINNLNYEEGYIVGVQGGETRHDSVQHALQYVKTPYCIIHDAARPYTAKEDIEALISCLDDTDAATLCHQSVDSAYVDSVFIPKRFVSLITTPQAFNRKAMDYILENPDNSVDHELELLAGNDFEFSFVQETSKNTKITYKKDLIPAYLIGYSLDFHPFKESNYLLLGGVKIPSTFGLAGHSDADCLYHAVAESILGALSKGDLGTNFPDTDVAYKDMDSSYFVKVAKSFMYEAGFVVNNIDIMVYLETPKLKDYIYEMRKNVATLLDMDISLVSIKATTFEKKGPIGTSEGIGCESTVLLRNKI